MKLSVHFFIFLLSFTSLKLRAQYVGIVKDSLENKIISKASVCFIRASDSVLLHFVRTDSSGRFKVFVKDTGKIIIRISYPEFASVTDTFHVSSGGFYNLGVFSLLTKVHILNEVVVKKNIGAVRLKNDTTEFNPASYKLREGSNVEDLFRKFPGFTVDRNGKILFQGEQITSVLVDGEEFFGNDPTIATRNLSASDVKKVQLYDRKNQLATLTGIDDGNTKKQLNVILKEDAKKGHFGKFEGGKGNNNSYQGKVTANKFSILSKRGIYSAIDNNTGQNSMNYYEENDYGGTIALYDGNSVRFTNSRDEFSSDVKGLPENRNLAFMLNQKFGNTLIKSNTTNNYNYKRQNVNGIEENTTTYVLSDSLFLSKRKNRFNNDKFKHSINSRNEFVIDTMRTVNINFRASKLNGWETNESVGSYTTQDSNVINNSNKSNRNEFNNDNSRIDIYFSSKMRKKGRSLSITFLYENADITNSNWLYNKIQYYASGIPISTEVTDQIRKSSLRNHAVQSSFGWIEPLSSRSSVAVSYILTNSSSQQNIEAFANKSGIYDSIVSDLSGNYALAAKSNRFSFAYNTSWRKSSLRISIAYQILRLSQESPLIQLNLKRTFNNLFPNVTYRVPISKSGNITVSYSGSNQQPSLNQLMPIPNNIDPLNIYIGNIALKQAFTNTASFSISDYNTIKNKSLSFNAVYGIINNAFAYMHTVSNLGKREIMTVNVSGTKFYNVAFSYHKQFQKQKLTIDLAPRYRGAINVNFTNGDKIYTYTNRYSLGVRIDKQFNDIVDTYLWYVPEWNISKTSSMNYTTKYAIHFLKGRVELNFRNNLIIRVDNNTEFRPRLSNFYKNQTVSVFDIALEKNLIKKKDLRIALTCNDILGQQIGFDRNIGSNFISEDTYSAVQRLFLLSVRWRFSANRLIRKEE